MTREEQDQRHPDSLEGLTMTEALDQVQGPPLQVAFRGAPLNPMFTPAEVAGLRAEGYEVGPTQRMSDLPPLPDPLPEPEEFTGTPWPDGFEGPPTRVPGAGQRSIRFPVATIGDLVVCDDGTVWGWRWSRGLPVHGTWYEDRPPIPGTRAARERGA